MLKKILNLDGAQALHKNDQKTIIGGSGGTCIDTCSSTWSCPPGSHCAWFACNGNGNHMYAICISEGGLRPMK